MIATFRKSADLLGRIFLSTIFAVSIPPKIINFKEFVERISQKNIPESFSIILLILAILCLIFGVGLLVFGNYNKLGASLLLVFIVPTTLIMHFSPFQPFLVFTNLGLIGGLIIILTRMSETSSSNNTRFERTLSNLVNSFKDK